MQWLRMSTGGVPLKTRNAPNENPPVEAAPPKAGVEVVFVDPNKPPPAVPVLAAPKAGVEFAVFPNPPGG